MKPFTQNDIGLEVGASLSLEEAFARYGLLPARVESPQKPEKGPLPAEWFIVYTLKPKKVIEELDDLSVHHFRAMMKVERLMRRTRKYANPKTEIVEDPMFPGYLFVGAGLVDPKYIDGVLGALMASETAYYRLPNKIIEDLKAAIDLGLFDKKKALREIFKPGSDVRIEDGPFIGFPGKVKKAMSGLRAEVLVDIFGRPTPVVLDLGQLKAA